MSFDSRNLERLKSLGRKLPQPLPSPEKQNQKQKPSSNKAQHPIETEENPKILFQELIKASPDGNIPSHLIDRLKETEIKQAKEQRMNRDQPQSSGESSSHLRIHPQSNKRTENKPTQPQLKEKSKEKSLYIDFHKLLLEEEEDE